MEILLSLLPFVPWVTILLVVLMIIGAVTHNIVYLNQHKENKQISELQEIVEQNDTRLEQIVEGFNQHTEATEKIVNELQTNQATQSSEIESINNAMMGAGLTRSGFTRNRGPRPEVDPNMV